MDRVIAFASEPENKARLAAEAPRRVGDILGNSRYASSERWELLKQIKLQDLTPADVNYIGLMAGRANATRLVIWRRLEIDTNGYTSASSEPAATPSVLAGKKCSGDSEGLRSAPRRPRYRRKIPS
jgi:hypothetical protein